MTPRNPSVSGASAVSYLTEHVPPLRHGSSPQGETDGARVGAVDGVAVVGDAEGAMVGSDVGWLLAGEVDGGALGEAVGEHV